MKILTTIFLGLVLGSVQALTVEDLKVSFGSLRLKAQDASANKAAELRTKYLKALGQAQEKLQKRGRLDDALKVAGEIKLTNEKAWPLPAIEAPVPADLASLRKVFVKEFLVIRKEEATTVVAASKKLEHLLSKKIVELTKGGNLEGAKQARDYKESLAVEPKLLEYRALLDRVGRDGNAATAYRVRRYGDDIEVLVRYDASGKLSNDSPISNTVEMTGGRKERGETAATTLGGFLGAKGHDPDPQIIYEATFDKANQGELSLLDIEAGQPVEYKGKTGTPFKISDTARNPMINLPVGSLPPLEASCVVRITCEFYVPRENKGVEAISFNQGGGPALADRSVGKKGAWTTEVIESAAKGEVPNLRLFIGGVPGVQLPQIRGEAVVIHSLKVEIIRPSVFICEQYGKDGGVLKKFPDGKDQEVLALNGELGKPADK